MKSLLHSKYCFNAKTQKKKKILIFLCQNVVCVCKNQKLSLNNFGFLNVPLTHTIDPNDQKLFFSDSILKFEFCQNNIERVKSRNNCATNQNQGILSTFFQHVMLIS